MHIYATFRINAMDFVVLRDFFSREIASFMQFQHKMCRFLVYLGKISSVFELYLCNCIAVAVQLHRLILLNNYSIV